MKNINILIIAKIFLIIVLLILAIYSLIFNFNKIFLKKEYIDINFAKIITEKDDNSMYPEIKNTDLIILTPNRELKENEIIAYTYNNKISIQRISSIENKDGRTYYITKGDNNFYNNIEKIEEKQIIGKVKYKIPIIGCIMKFFQNTYVCLFIIIAIFYNIILMKKSIGKHKK